MNPNTLVPCTRCGVRRQVKPERGFSELCIDCRLVEQDLAVRGCGTNRGYHKHLRDRTLPCDPCLAAQRAHQERLRRAKGIPPMKPAECGTNSGYGRHMNARETPCDDCKRAHREVGREWRNAKRQKAA